MDYPHTLIYIGILLNFNQIHQRMDMHIDYNYEYILIYEYFVIY
jgi:hypothetical protein